MKIILQETPRTNSHFIRQQTNLPFLVNRRKFIFLCDFYLLFNNISPTLISNVTACTPIFNYTLRSSASSKLFIPGMNKSVGQRSLQYLGPHTFNSLPDHIRSASTFTMFRNKLRSYLLKPYTYMYDRYRSTLNVV